MKALAPFLLFLVLLHEGTSIEVLRERSLIQAGQVDGYEFIQGMDSADYDITNGGTDLQQLKAICDSRTDCLGFNTNGWLKSYLKPRDQWYRWSDSPTDGFYVKKPTTTLPGYDFIQGMDSADNDLANGGTDLQHLKGICDSNPSCAGFNTNGWLKSYLKPRDQWYQWSDSPTDGFYVKQTSTSQPQPEQPKSSSEECWISAYGRGVGAPITTCRSGEDKSGALCYPPCSNGYTGDGPVCWQDCPSGFTNTGGHCLKPSSYGRGAGYALWNKDKCTKENSQGCEKYGAMYYPVCADGFSAFGCCVCSPTCPSGMTDIGVSCQKKSYGRGVGQPLICAAGLEQDAALCYPPCDSDFKGVGPVCWGSCPSDLYACGALCLKSQAECTTKMLDIGLKALKGVFEVASEIENPIGAIISAAETIADIAGDLVYPICGN